MRTRLTFCFAVLATLAACDASGPTGASPGGGAAQLGVDGYGRDWVGLYAGAGRGVVGTQNVEVRDAQLTIALDAGSDRIPSCPQCVTITLDSLFSAINVSLDDPQSVVVQHVTGPAPVAVHGSLQWGRRHGQRPAGPADRRLASGSVVDCRHDVPARAEVGTGG